MKFSDFATKFSAPQKEAAAAAAPALPGEVTIAGAVVGIEAGICLVDVNGARYEIPVADVVDVTLLSALVTGKGDGADVPKVTEKDVVLFKVSAKTVATLRVPVQAAVIAAAGMWVAAAPTPTCAQSPQ